MNFTLPKIYPITDTHLSGLSHAAQVVKLIEGGARIIQIRDKEASSKDFFEAASEAIEIAHKANVKIIINDRVDIALLCRADGVHLGQDDMPPAEARKILGKKAIIGYSTHTPEQVKAALDLPIDYIAFGPVFDTRTKKKAETVVGLDTLRVAGEIARDIQLVAIGGINVGNITAVLQTGADSAAIISDLISNPDDISFRLNRLREQVDESSASAT